jgi:hypothetical protein
MKPAETKAEIRLSREASRLKSEVRSESVDPAWAMIRIMTGMMITVSVPLRRKMGVPVHDPPLHQEQGFE